MISRLKDILLIVWRAGSYRKKNDVTSHIEKKLFTCCSRYLDIKLLKVLN